jgi:CheY-like chemotaxis protein
MNTVMDKQTIFVAEDNPGDVYLIKEALVSLRLPLTVAVDGEEAIAMLERIDGDPKAACPVAALVDVNLPKRNGSEVLTRLRQSPRFGSAPTVIITSSDSPVDRAEFLKLGATQYFRKPSNLDDFLELGGIVRDLLQRQS